MRATALVAAAARARPGGPVDDPYASLFLDAHPSGGGTRRRILTAGTDEIAHRTALLDALLTDRADGTAFTLLNLGAGYCARPYRLALPGCRRVIEVDAPEVLDLKTRVLRGHEPAVPVDRVAGDVRDTAFLAGLLASIPEPLVVLSEGLLVYLPPGELAALASVPAGRAEWFCDVVSVSSAAAMSTVAEQAGTRLTLYGLSTLEVFESAGWRVDDYRVLPVARRSFGGRGGREVVDGVIALSRGS